MTNSQAVEKFKKLLEICDFLLGPTGCPWDREQTLVSMRESILEEACEVIEAIDEGNDTNLIEELGDLLYNIVFFAKLAEKENRFSMMDPIQRIAEKLISRHPHVFGENRLKHAEEVIAQWDLIKKMEKNDRESLMDGIPKGLPALARAYKIAGKMVKANYTLSIANAQFANEEELGVLLFEIVKQAKKMKINPETALRKTMLNQEKTFRDWESCNIKKS